MTDDSPIYNFKLTQFEKAPHGRINHSKRKYVRGERGTGSGSVSISRMWHHRLVKHKWMWTGFLIGLAMAFLASFIFHIPR
jgi:hypothetical protein